ncbi:MAG: hypothetical protein Kow0059_08220 [Candidatus Sumerlaeia bacterium]
MMIRRQTAMLLAAGWLVFLLCYQWWYGHLTLLDFAPIYLVGKMFLAGRWECFYDFLTRDFGYGLLIYTGPCLGQFAAAAHYPITSENPLTLYLYSPVFIPLAVPPALLPWAVVEKIVFVLNCGAVAGIALWAARIGARGGGAPWLFAALVLLLLPGEPARWCVHTGQATPWMLLLTMAAWRWADRGRGWAAGAALAVAFWMKFFPALLILHWMRSGHWRAIRAFAVAAVLWGAVGLAVFGPSVHGAYWRVLRVMSTGAPIFPVNQSFESALMRWRLPIQRSVSNVNWYLPRDVKLAALALKAVVLVALAVALLRPAAGRRHTLQAALVLSACPILLSVSWNHYTLFSLPLTALVFADAWERLGTEGKAGPKRTVSADQRVMTPDDENVDNQEQTAPCDTRFSVSDGAWPRAAAWCWLAALVIVVVFQQLHVQAVRWLTDEAIALVGRRSAEPFTKILLMRHLLGTLLLLASGIASLWMTRRDEAPAIRAVSTG